LIIYDRKPKNYGLEIRENMGRKSKRVDTRIIQIEPFYPDLWFMSFTVEKSEAELCEMRKTIGREHENPLMVFP